QQDIRCLMSEHASHIRVGQIYLTEHTAEVDPEQHQLLDVMRSVIRADGQKCVVGELQTYEYYETSDQSLGGFLLSLFDPKTPCPLSRCSSPLMAHRIVFYHANGQVNVAVEHRPAPVAGSGHPIVMWSQCKICHKSTPYVAMDAETQ